MDIIHRYIDQLVALEEDHVFCDEPLAGKYKILVIGTFNPNDDSCLKPNTASWFYGRKQSNFWNYFPSAFVSRSLHHKDVPNLSPHIWKTFCKTNKIVIIDLIKRIKDVSPLEDFGDKDVESKISLAKHNTEYFDIAKAFKEIKFDKIIYSLA